MRFWKWHALGNSYLVVEQAIDPDTARRLCDVRYGIGADGVLAVEGESVAIWNPDGSQAEFSGNGMRIAASWLMERSGAREVELRVDSRSYRAQRREDGLVEMSVGEAEVGELETVELDGEHIELTTVSVGNPHAVVRTDAGRGELLRLGPLLETAGRFPDRTNVQLVRVDGPHEVTALVWERGAGETSASGSSAVAVASAAIANGWCESPVTVRMPGGDLRVELDGENRLTLVGPAVEICAGEVRITG
jgi:diaminopimelate epimerase